MARAINDDISYKGSTIIVGVKFPKVDNLYSFATLLNAGNIKVEYYVINTNTYYDVTNSLYRILPSADSDYDNEYAFTVNTSTLHTGVLMVKCTATIPAHGTLPQRTEIAKCSTGIAIIE